MPGKSLSYRAPYCMLAQLAANAVGFITSMVLTRAFTEQEMGDYQQLMMLYAIFSSILIAGLPSCLTYFYPIADEKQNPATGYIILGLLSFSGVAIGLATFFSAPTSSATSRTTRGSVCSCAVFPSSTLSPSAAGSSCRSIR